MRRAIAGLLFAPLLLLAGCTRTADYLEVVNGQERAMRDVTDILKKVHNEKDLEAAKEELDERFARLEAIARKARDLPKPPPPEVEQKIDLAKFQRTVREMTAEVQRVKELPGGREFFAQFEGRTALLPRSAD